MNTWYYNMAGQRFALPERPLEPPDLPLRDRRDEDDEEEEYHDSAGD